MNSKTLGVSLIWLLLAGGLFYFFDSKVHPNTADKLSEGTEVRLERDLSGHYRAEAFINGVKATVMVDTGATDVAISSKFAEQLGIQSNQAIRTHTANGDTVAYTTRLKSIKLGSIEAGNVAATIVPDLETDILLGMEEFLKPMELSQYALDKAISVSPRRINEIVHGTRSITADADLRLCRFFGLSEGCWLRGQVRYDTELAKDALAGVLEKIQPWERKAA